MTKIKHPKKTPKPKITIEELVRPGPIVEATSAAMAKFFTQVTAALARNSEEIIRENTGNKKISSAVDRLTIKLIDSLGQKSSSSEMPDEQKSNDKK